MIICTATGLAEMREHLENDKKIAAIKALRRTATPPPGLKSISLRDAKWAVERYQHQVLGDSRYSSTSSEGMPIVAAPIVKELLVDFGTGPVTIDIETMELKALSQLESIGLEACGRMLELCQVIKAFSEGKSICVVEEEE